MDLIEMLAQVLLAIGLLYGMIVAFRHWKTTVPRSGDFDAEFANHSYENTSRWMRLTDQRAHRNRPRRKPADKHHRFIPSPG